MANVQRPHESQKSGLPQSEDDISNPLSKGGHLSETQHPIFNFFINIANLFSAAINLLPFRKISLQRTKIIEKLVNFEAGSIDSVVETRIKGMLTTKLGQLNQNELKKIEDQIENQNVNELFKLIFFLRDEKEIAASTLSFVDFCIDGSMTDRSQLFNRLFISDTPKSFFDSVELEYLQFGLKKVLSLSIEEIETLNKVMDTYKDGNYKFPSPHADKIVNLALKDPNKLTFMYSDISSTLNIIKANHQNISRENLFKIYENLWNASLLFEQEDLNDYFSNVINSKNPVQESQLTMQQIKKELLEIKENLLMQIPETSGRETFNNFYIKFQRFLDNPSNLYAFHKFVCDIYQNKNQTEIIAAHSEFMKIVENHELSPDDKELFTALLSLDSPFILNWYSKNEQ